MKMLQARMRNTVATPVAAAKRPMRLPRQLLVLGVVAFGAWLPGGARAASGASCTVDTSSAQIAFGIYDPLSLTPLDGTGTLAISCDKNNVSATFALDRGGSTTFLPRKMSSGANVLPYNLYVGSPNSGVVFGDGTSGTQTASAITVPVGGGTFVGQVQVFGRIQAGLNPASGDYTDTIRVDVTF
jgi:spore coat protein U-like protein